MHPLRRWVPPGYEGNTGEGAHFSAPVLATPVCACAHRAPGRILQDPTALQGMQDVQPRCLPELSAPAEQAAAHVC